MDIAEEAQRLAQELLIIDGHIDLPYRLKNQGFDFSDSSLQWFITSAEGDFDLERARRGGLNAAFMAIYIPAELQEQGGAFTYAIEMLDFMDTLLQRFPNDVSKAKSPDELRNIVREGKIALPYGLENGAALEGDINRLALFQDRGIVYITLTHSKDNEICDSSYDENRTWNGLSPFGTEVIKEMNRLGMLIDVSHVTDSAFYQVLQISEAPVIATHSSARHFTPDLERNMDDDMIRAIADKGGMVMVNFGTFFLDGEVNLYNKERMHQRQQLLGNSGFEPGSAEADELLREFDASFPRKFADVAKVVDHIDHIVAIAGIGAIGLGSDFDGVGDSLPTGLKDVSQYPNLIQELLSRGYSEEDIEKITSLNFLSVWERILSKKD